MLAKCEMSASLHIILVQIPHACISFNLFGEYFPEYRLGNRSVGYRPFNRLSRIYNFLQNDIRLPHCFPFHLSVSNIMMVWPLNSGISRVYETGLLAMFWCIFLCVGNKFFPVTFQIMFENAIHLNTSLHQSKLKMLKLHITG